MSDEQPRLPYMSLSPEGIAAMQSLEHYLNALSSLERSLLEMVRLRVSLLNGCDYCIGLHRQELEWTNEPEELVQAIARWRETEVFTHRQRAALQWADAVTNIQTSRASDAEYSALEQHFSNKEIVDLTLAIGSINAWNRLAIAFRSRWKPSATLGQEAESIPNAEITSAREHRLRTNPQAKAKH